MAIETLEKVPSLAPIFAKAALPGKSKGGSALPDAGYAVSIEVDRGHLLEYQRLCGFTVGDVLPHTYPHIMGFPLQAKLMSRGDFPFPLVGLVHIENVITVHRRLTADDVLDLTVTADDLRAHPKGKQVDLVTVATVDGEVVWEGRSTYLARGKSDPEAEHSVSPELPTGPAAGVWRLPSDLGRQYGAVSGDVNPIHMSALTAKAMGFPRAIAHGMWTFARSLAAIGPQTADPCTSHVWFKKPVLLPTSVEFVIDPAAEPLVAGLRKARSAGTEHLVLTLD